MILAALASLVLWPIYLALFLVLAIVGLVLLVPLCALHAWVSRPSYFAPFRANGMNYHWPTWLLWAWGNEEDGVRGPVWWRQRTRVGMGFPRNWWRASLSAYRWSALRNPVNNLRFIPVLCPRIEPKRIRSRKWEGGAFTWQGVYAGVIHFPVIRGHAYRFWLGWKLKPEDVDGVADDDMRKVRCGFAIQFKRI